MKPKPHHLSSTALLGALFAFSASTHPLHAEDRPSPENLSIIPRYRIDVKKATQTSTLPATAPRAGGFVISNPDPTIYISMAMSPEPIPVAATSNPSALASHSSLEAVSPLNLAQSPNATALYPGGTVTSTLLSAPVSLTHDLLLPKAPNTAEPFRIEPVAAPVELASDLDLSPSVCAAVSP